MRIMAAIGCKLPLQVATQVASCPMHTYGDRSGNIFHMTKARDNLTRIFLICWQHLQDAAPNNNNNSNNMCSSNNNNCSSSINYNLLKQQQLQLHQQQQQQLQLHQQQQQQQQAPHESSLNVEAVILQNQVDTLHWQLKQVSCPAPSPTDKDLGSEPCQRHATCDMQTNRDLMPLTLSNLSYAKSASPCLLSPPHPLCLVPLC